MSGATKVKCRQCQRALEIGESAWADDWKVMDLKGTRATWRMETRYTCDDCHKGGPVMTAPNPDRFTADDDLTTVTNWHADFPESVCGPLLAADLAAAVMDDVMAAVEAMLKEAAE